MANTLFCPTDGVLINETKVRLVDRLVLYLVYDAARYITGSALALDGGAYPGLF